MSFFKTLVSPNKAEAKKDLEDPGAEKPPATAADLKSDNVNFAPQDTQAAAKNPAATEIAKDGAKEKGAATPLPLAKMFWKKSVKEESVPTGSEENEVCESPVEVVKSQEAESALQTVDLNEDGHAPPKPAESKSKREEGKPQKPPSWRFSDKW
ncbi:breast carcinoma-amplified sequence 1-like [Talpa occidentalis]|uniref:breast carcinoma-amplified sequence 1-like n=1 Tax=Talpa occidentalis TaxID=50954 RepID=UPI00188F9D86|nr:breast carcinoma-amplified sequence 1-like [Talpa occidentalis]